MKKNLKQCKDWWSNLSDKKEKKKVVRVPHCLFKQISMKSNTYCTNLYNPESNRTFLFNFAISIVFGEFTSIKEEFFGPCTPIKSAPYLALSPEPFRRDLFHWDNIQNFHWEEKDQYFSSEGKESLVKYWNSTQTLTCIN